MKMSLKCIPNEKGFCSTVPHACEEAYHDDVISSEMM